MSSPAKTAVTSTGRGIVFISAAKLWFMVAGYAVVFTLPSKWAFGSPAKYGVWVLILNLVSLVNNVMVTATIQSVSKFSSEGEGKMPSVLRAALRMHTFVGGGTALLFFLLAPWVASFLHDPSLTPLLRVASVIILAYSYYASFVGAANGTRAFHKQAALDATFSTVRTALVVGIAVATHSVLASTAGFAGAAVFVMLVSMAVVGFGKRPSATEKFPLATMLRFFLGVALYLLIQNGLMFADGIWLKRLVAEAAERAHAIDPALVADTQQGYYGAVQQLARIPYQLILAVTFVIFPLMSRATFEGDSDRTRGYVESTMRYSLMVVSALAAILGSRPHATLGLVFKPEYGEGAFALALLLFGYVCFALFTIAGTIINSSGRTRPTTLIGAATLALAIVLIKVSVDHALSHGLDCLRFAAGASAISMAFGVLQLGIYLKREFGSFLPIRTVLVVLCATGVTAAAGQVWPATGILAGKLGTLIWCGVAGTLFAGVLIGTGELNPRALLKARAQGKNNESPQNP